MGRYHRICLGFLASAGLMGTVSAEEIGVSTTLAETFVQSAVDAMRGAAGADHRLHVATRWSPDSNRYRFSLFESMEDVWTEFNVSTKPAGGGDEFLALSEDGAAHLLWGELAIAGGYAPITLRYGRRDAEDWSATSLATNLLSLASALQLDAQGRPHGVWVCRFVGAPLSYYVYYASSSAGGWSTELVDNSSPTVVSLAVLTNGDPVLALGGESSDGAQPLRLLKRSAGHWTPLWTGTANARSLHLRRDGFDRLHLGVMTGSPTSVRYVRLSALGAVEVDKTYSMGTNDVQLELASDGSPRMTFAGQMVNPVSNETYPQFFGGTTAPHVFFVNETPYLAGNSHGFSNRFQVAAMLSAPGPARLVDRGPYSLSFDWTPLSTTAPLLGFRLREGGGGGSTLLSTATVSGSLSGLLPNQTYETALTAIYPGLAVSSAAVIADTLAATPKPLVLSRPSGNSLSVVWADGGNPTGTRHRVRLKGADGSVLTQETTVATNVAFLALDPGLSVAVECAAVNGEGLESPAARAEAAAGTGTTRTTFVFSGSTVSATVGAGTAITVLNETVFPALTEANWTATGRGFRILCAPNRPLSAAYDYGAGVFADESHLALARFDEDRSAWTLPSGSVDGVAHRLTASALKGGLFQVVERSSAEGGVGRGCAYPNPFRAGVESVTVSDVPPGTRVRVLSAGGERLRELWGDASGRAFWDGRDGRGRTVPAGVYTLAAERDGAERRLRVIVRAP